MREWLAQLTDLSSHVHMLVHATGIVSKRRAKKTNRPVARPPAMLYFAAEEKISPWYTKRLPAIRCCHHSPNLITESRRSPLVRIDNKEPTRSRARNRRIALRTNRAERMRHHRRTGAVRELHRRIRRIVLHDDHFTSPRDTRHAGFDVRGFVPRRDDDRHRD